MPMLKKSFILLLGVWGASLCTGCQMLHELQPHRWKRLNYGVDGMPNSDYQTFHHAPGLPENGYFACIPEDIHASPVTAVR